MVYMKHRGKDTALAQLKKSVRQEVDNRRGELTDLALKIHGNPELAHEEVKAAQWLVEYLAANGFQVTSGICDLPTAFRASYGSGKPVIAMLAEYDALPDIGHGCGHNLMAATAVGAAVAAKSVADKAGGTIQVIGTPAEEKLGGKITLVEKGCFDGVDVAMETHPASRIDNPSAMNLLAMTTLDVEFHGKPAHAAAAPWNGISALDALIQGFNNINALRSRMKDRCRISGIITEGGKFPNVVPEYAAGTFMVRAPDDAMLDTLCEKALDCFKGAGVATGARLEYRWGPRCRSLRHNSVLIGLWIENMTGLGRSVTGIVDGSGSTDMGNVSQVVPALHPFLALATKPLALHSREFALAAASELGIAMMLDSAKGQAMVAADIVCQPGMLERIKEDFREGKAR